MGGLPLAHVRSTLVLREDITGYENTKTHRKIGSNIPGSRSTSARTLLTFTLVCLGVAGTAYGQTTDPWSTAAGQLSTAFTGPIAKGLSLVAIVLGGMQLAFSEGKHSRVIGGLIFGVGLALGAASFFEFYHRLNSFTTE